MKSGLPVLIYDTLVPYGTCLATLIRWFWMFCEGFWQISKSDNVSQVRKLSGLFHCWKEVPFVKIMNT